MDYKDAPEVREIAQELIPEYHKHLEGVRIAYAFTDKSGKKCGKDVLGKTTLESGKSVWFAAGAPSEYRSGKFFLIAISELAWEFLDFSQKRALVDHELSHCGKDPETLELCLWTHDIEEFGAVVQRHGLWLDDVRRFVEAATAAQVPELPFEGADAPEHPDMDDDDRAIRVARLRAYYERYLDDPGIDPADEAIERLGRETAERIEALESGVGYVPADDCALLGRWRVVYPDMTAALKGIPAAMVVEALERRMPGATHSVEDGVATIAVPVG